MLLELKGIEKRFGGVVALARGDLCVEAGEVHALLGENGAGKSTLMKIVAGMQSLDAGEMLWQGRPVRFRRPADAAAEGISMVHQESLLAPHMTVAENIFLGCEPRNRFGFIDKKKMLRDARRLIEERRFPLQADWLVRRLSPAGKQLVEICRAIQRGSSLIIFDEPTSSLSESEAQEVFRIVRDLRARRMGVIYITHRLEELRGIADAVTILRDGVTVHQGALAGLSTQEIIRHMVGREVTSIYQRSAYPAGREVLRVERLTRRPLFQDIAFSLRAGEIVGMAGLVGAGRTELCHALFGLLPVESGRILLEGTEVAIRSPQDAVRAGIALIPEDRQHHGLALGLPILYNASLAGLGDFSRLGILNRLRERRAVTEVVGRLRLKADSVDQIARRLSGGNQQKVVIAKWLVKSTRVFLFDEPTRGIDVGAKREVFQVMDELARQGAAVLMVSSELPELLQVPDRILVMREGRISAELPGRTTQEQIMRYAALEHDHVLLEEPTEEPAASVPAAPAERAAGAPDNEKHR
jgi:ABC-type sugar transport system ATPase subunit